MAKLDALVRESKSEGGRGAYGGSANPHGEQWRQLGVAQTGSSSARQLSRSDDVLSRARTRSGPIPGTVSHSSRPAARTPATLPNRARSARAEAAEMPGTAGRSASAAG